ncbi:MAG: hypothetical protein AAGM45_18835 [Cyanobacteria bacterium J06588_5]
MTLTTFSTSQEAQQAAALMDGYRFELGSHDAPQWVSLWLASYSPTWIRSAVIEALYQGRYKAFSVRQILELWQRREKPVRHASHDFEAAVCREYESIERSPVSNALTPKSIAVPVPSLSTASSQEPATLRASRRIHQSLSSISFNLSETHQSAEPQPDVNLQAESSEDLVDDTQIAHRTSRRELIETAQTLQSQRQSNGVSYSSARAIQPFKPALPFSAQTLRLARQKALATQ